MKFSRSDFEMQRFESRRPNQSSLYRLTSDLAGDIAQDQ